FYELTYSPPDLSLGARRFVDRPHRHRHIPVARLMWIRIDARRPTGGRPVRLTKAFGGERGSTAAEEQRYLIQVDQLVVSTTCVVRQHPAVWIVHAAFAVEIAAEQRRCFGREPEELDASAVASFR